MFGGFFDDIIGDMMDPFGMFGGRRQRPRNQMQVADGRAVGFPGFGPMMPFGFPDIGGMMSQMEQAMHNPDALNGPGFVSHSVMQMSYDGTTGQPKIYQESATTRQGPGGVRETRRTVTDTFTGTKKMEIGHHMNGRGRVVERKQDLNTNQMEENEELINLDDEEKDVFEREWQQRATMGQRSGMPMAAAAIAAPPRSSHRADVLALPAPPSNPIQGSSSRPSHQQRRARAPHGSALHGSRPEHRRGPHVDINSPSTSSSQPHHSSGHVRTSSSTARRQRRDREREHRRHLPNH